MNKDFRVSVTLPTHPKTLKLMRRLGDRAFYNLIRFWAFVSTNKPDGNLRGYDDDDIEIAADWIGTPGEFVAALLDPKIRFLEEVDGCYLVHDWQDHNEYACHAASRSEKAKKAAAARWDKSSEHSDKVETDAKKCSEHELSNATSINELCPSPSPSPSQDKYPNGYSSTEPLDSADPTEPSPQKCPFGKIQETYNQILGNILPQCKSTNKTIQRNVQARWREDRARQSLDWWLDYFNTVSESDFLMGRTNSDRPFRASFDWLIKPTNMSKVINGNYRNIDQNDRKRREDELRQWAIENGYEDEHGNRI